MSYDTLKEKHVTPGGGWVLHMFYDPLMYFCYACTLYITPEPARDMRGVYMPIAI